MNVDGDIPIIDTKKGYDRWAEVYDGDGNPLVALETPVFDDLLGPPAGLTVLDVGCGTGRHAVRLARQGARVTAVDFSDGMLAKARAKPFADKVTFVVHDLAKGLPGDDDAFDAVVCSLVLDHVTDLQPLASEFKRVLKPDGRLVVTVMHPAMTLKGVQARFIDPATQSRVALESATNTMADYINAFLRAGLVIQEMVEKSVTAALARDFPRAEKHVGWPIMVAWRLAKGPARAHGA